MQKEEGRGRVVVENIDPEIDGGRYPIKRTLGEKVTVAADAFTDGHDAISCVLRHRHEQAEQWSEVVMVPQGNDRWQAEFEIHELGRHRYTVQAWIDHFKTWRRDLAKRVEAEQDVAVDLQIGANLIEAAAERAPETHSRLLGAYAEIVRAGGVESVQRALSPDLAELMFRYADRLFATSYKPELLILCGRVKERYSSWYELFPRSTSSTPGKHGTFKDVEARLPYVASMGFDVLYLPPIHPIGRSFRKGKNNTTVCEPNDPGSPWGIGGAEGGHTAIHPELGTLQDLHHLIQAADSYGLELALDLAFQVSPDHPYVAEHEAWFRKRPDGTIQYAENPPKKYQDIYPFDFETEDWEALWDELKRVVQFWVDQGIRIFRVDNPHTKPFPFWEWLIGEIRRDYPETIFLSEAFTRPKVMYRLAKLGFQQSYNYFPWRNTKWELIQYLTELTRTQVAEYFGPNLWPNTPDILPESLQIGGRPAFITRLVLAATLGASYGIYGPAYELLDNEPIAMGREEYLNSEKYEIKAWDLEHPDSIKDLIGRVNMIRSENPALQSNRSLRFLSIDNEQILAFTKTSEDQTNQILVVVNLDPHYTQAGFIEVPLEDLQLEPQMPYQVHDLLTDARYLWNGRRNYVELDPQRGPAHIFRIRRRVRTEHDFDYFM